MRGKILEKLDTEYEFFFLDVMRTSKENIFAISGEIERKKRIQKFLKEYASSEKNLKDEVMIKRLLLTDNLMESCYRYVMDHPELKTRAACLEYLKHLE